MIRVNRPIDTNTTITKSRRGPASTSTFTVDGESKAGAEQVGALPQSDLLGVLIALQGGDHPSDSDTVEWSHQALDGLEQLRDGLLQGSFDRDSIKNLSDHLQHAMETTSDPVLAGLQGQILLRVKVELAKIEHNSGLGPGKV